MNVTLQITAQGGVAMLHDDAVDLRQFGTVQVRRASNVEFDEQHQVWTVYSAKTGKALRSAITRAGALAWEKAHYSPTGPGWAELTGETA